MDERVVDIDPSARAYDENSRIGDELVRRGNDGLPEHAHVAAAVQDRRRRSEVEVHEVRIRTRLRVRRVHEIPVALAARFLLILNDVDAGIRIPTRREMLDSRAVDRALVGSDLRRGDAVTPSGEHRGYRDACHDRKKARPTAEGRRGSECREQRRETIEAWRPEEREAE